MDISFEVRRQNLALLIKDFYEGNRAAFCRATGKNPNLINLVLSSNPEYQRNIGEKLARDIEQRARIASGWLDTPHGIGTRNVTRIPVLTDSRDVPDHAPLKGDFSVTLPMDDPMLALRSTGTANLVIVLAQESCMAPTIAVGDHVWLDLGVKMVKGDAIYLLRMKDKVSLLRRIQQLPNGDICITADNPAYSPQTFKASSRTMPRVIGKAIAVSKRAPL
jgi:SOS-response transcriptional repressor LexA